MPLIFPLEILGRIHGSEKKLMVLLAVLRRIILTIKICLLLFPGQAADSQSSEGLAAGGAAEETRDVDLEVPRPRLSTGEPSGRESERG